MNKVNINANVNVSDLLNVEQEYSKILSQFKKIADEVYVIKDILVEEMNSGGFSEESLNINGDGLVYDKVLAIKTDIEDLLENYCPEVLSKIKEILYQERSRQLQWLRTEIYNYLPNRLDLDMEAYRQKYFSYIYKLDLINKELNNSAYEQRVSGGIHQEKEIL